MVLSDTIYAYAVGRVRALETRLLERSRFERMIDAASVEEALKVLAESDYANAVSELADIHEFEEMLTAAMQECIELLLNISPKPEEIAIFSLRFDIHNLKVLLKAKFLGIKSDLLINAGTLALDDLQYAVSEEYYRDLPPSMRFAVEKIHEDFLLNRNPQVIDLLLDAVLYEQLIAAAEKMGSSFLKQLFIKQIDLTNLKSLIRVKRMGFDRDFLKKVLLPHGSIAIDRLTVSLEEPYEALINTLAMTEYAELAGEGVREWLEKQTASRLEKLADDYITAYLKRGKWTAFGVEPLVGYLWAKEIEIKNIRLVLVGKINKLPAEAIRERLRNVYI